MQKKIGIPEISPKGRKTGNIVVGKCEGIVYDLSRMLRMGLLLCGNGEGRDAWIKSREYISYQLGI